MSRDLLKKLGGDAHRLTTARLADNVDGIKRGYRRISKTLNEVYKTQDATTALAVEKTLIASEQNGINKASNTHKTIIGHLDRIKRAEIANLEQRKNPGTYHRGAMRDHGSRHFKDGTAFDAIRIALADCRKHAKDQIAAIGADENKERRNTNMLRHGGLANAERAYVERQVEHQEKYGSPEIKKQTRQKCLKSFDAKMRNELRELKLTPEPELKQGQSR